MSSIEYDDIFARFLAVTDAYDVAALVEDDANTMMSEWLHSVRSLPKVRKLFSTISIDDETQKLSYELRNPNLLEDGTEDVESDDDFIIEVFAYGSAWKWCNRKYKSVLNTNQVYGGKEEKFYSQANHTEALKVMCTDCMQSLYNIISNHVTNNNSYLNEE